MRLNFRKIASVATSALMTMSTVALAAAANYPAPFVSGGSADVAIVWGGDDATNTDLVAAANIQSSLASALSANSEGSSDDTSVEGGDSVLLAKPSDNVNLRNNVNTVFGSSLTDQDLEELLADGTYENENNEEFDYEQTISLGTGMQLEYFSDSDYNDREPTVGINLTSNQVVLNYSLDFIEDPSSTVSSGDLVDIETTNIEMLGRDYFILDADNSTLALTLLDSANSEFVAEGDTATVTAGDNTYEISIQWISTSEVILVVNGESTNTLSEGETQKLDDGSYIGIKDILARDVAGSVGQVEFSIGSGKIELTPGQAIELNDDSVNEVTAEITRGTASGGKEKLSRINLVWTTDDEEFITTENELVMPGFENIKLSLPEFVQDADETTTIEEGGSDYMQIKTTIENGDVTIPFLFANSSGEFTGIGKDSSNRLVTTLGTNILFNETRGDEWLVASWNSSSDSESYLLKFTDFTVDNNVHRVTVSRYEDGTSQSICEDRQSGNTCNIGSLSLTLNNVTKSGVEKTVNITGNAGSSFRNLYTAEGLKIVLPVDVGTAGGSNNVLGNINFSNASAGYGYDSFFVGFNEENKDEDVAAGTAFNVTIDDQSDGEVEVSTITTGRSTITDPADSNHQLSRIYSDLATLVERMGSSSDQRDAIVTYSGTEAYGKVYLAADSATFSGGSGGSGATELGNIIVSDDEASQVSSKNMIVVGGSCVNSVAAALLGSDAALCGSAFEEATGVSSGSFLIQTFDSPFASSQVATLVAGYNAPDTTNAATYLRTQEVMTDAGKKYIGTSATSASMVEDGE